MTDWRKKLREQFATRCTFDRTERLLYARDLAALPGTVARLIRTMPDAVVQPLDAAELSFLAALAREHDVPLVPRGSGTSGYGGALPVRGGIVVEFSRMNRILSVDAERMTATVEPGVIWQNLDRALRREGLALRLYPTSAPGSTVGGWVAEGGRGIGSFRYGDIAENVTSLELVTPEGKVVKLEGADLGAVCGAEGTTGFITRVTIPLREAVEDVPLLVACPDIDRLESMLLALENEAGLASLWHVGFLLPELVRRRQQATGEHILPEDRPLLLLVYATGAAGHDNTAAEPGNAAAGLGSTAVQHGSAAAGTHDTADETRRRLLDICTGLGGEPLGDELAHHEWAERFYPMRLKRLGPSLVPAEAFVPSGRLAATVSEMTRRVEGVAIEGSHGGRGEVAVLGFVLGDERALGYNIDWAKSLLMLDIAEKNGGRPYVAGLYFTARAEKVLGRERLAMMAARKKEADPAGLFNPEKIISSGGSPLHTVMKAARMGMPFLDAAGKVVPRRGKDSPKLPKEIGREAVACAYCGYCRPVCTLYGGRGWESASPRGKWNFLREYMRGNTGLTQEMAETFLLCTTCKRCDDVCQVKAPVQAYWDELRGFLVQEKGFRTFPAFDMMEASFTLQNNIWANYRHRRAGWVPQDVTYREAGEVAYWAGCTASFLERDIARNAVRILKEGGVGFAYLGTDEACCGVPFLVSGKWDVWQRAVRHNVQELARRGVRKLIVSCPGCWVALAHYYREWAPRLGLEWNMEIEHITETTAALTLAGRLRFIRQVPYRATWHDPCHIGRHGGIYEAPREALRSLPGLDLREMAHNRQEGLCCGSVLTRVGEPVPTSDIIAGRRVSEAEDAGAEMILTTCPCCEFQLRVGGHAAGSSVRVVDFTGVIVEALGYEREDPTPDVLYMWKVFDRAIQQMSAPAMVEMMNDLMPGMFAHMPSVMQAGMGAMKRMPGAAQDAMLAAMDRMVLFVMPLLMKQMMPKMLPDINRYLEGKIPDMPAAMKELMPAMMPIIMERLMPALMPRVLPAVKPQMMEEMKKQLRDRRPPSGRRAAGA